MLKNFNRKTLYSLSLYGLEEKIRFAKQGGWQLHGQIIQQHNGHYGCLMVKEQKQRA